MFRLPLPRPSGLPTHPQRPGDVPLDPKEEGRSGRLAEKALYCAIEELRIAFSGRQPPAAPIVYARPAGAPALSVMSLRSMPPLPHAGEAKRNL